MNGERSLAEVLRRAELEPDDVDARIDAAYALDREGREAEAIIHYDAAWALGIPAARQRGFVVGYGSTLRNVGRLEQSVAVLAQAMDDDPVYPAYKVFLALALHSSGEHSAALATSLEALLQVAGGAPLEFQRAIAEYQRQLLNQAIDRG